jgi:hypothetical protein
MTRHQWRRFWCLWTPTYLVGVGMVAGSATLTDTTNGLTVLGALTALAGLLAATHDSRSTR